MLAFLLVSRVSKGGIALLSFMVAVVSSVFIRTLVALCLRV